MQQFTLVELWSHMGLFARLVVYLLGAMSLLAVVIAAERVLAFLRAGAASRRFAAGLSAALGAEGLDAASRAPQAGDGGHLGRVLAAGLAAYRGATDAGASPDLVVESTARALERQSAREVDGLKRGLNYLASVGSTAPFVGLLGTVVGIIDAFQAMAASGAGGLATVSAGIAEALVTTALGLLVAIPAVMAYNHLLGWVDGAAVDLSESGNELLDAVALRVDPAARAAAQGR